MKKHWDKNTGIHAKIGMIFSLGLALLAFEWKSYDTPSLVSLGEIQTEFEKAIDLPVLQQMPPPPPVKVMPVIVEVPNAEKIEEQLTELIFEPTENMPTIEPVIETDPEPVDDEEADKTFDIVEESTAPMNGMKAFYEYIQQNLEYPRQARRMGVQGKVFLEFVVDKDGSIAEVKVVRGIGAGCDEEAMRILKNSPKWKPAKQRGKPVKQRLTFPINFKLN